MRILVAGLKKNIQLTRLKEEGEKRGHEVDGCYSTELVIEADGKSFKPSLRGRSMKVYDLIYLMVSKRRWEWYTAAYYLNKNFGTKIVNQKVVDRAYNLFLTPAADYLKQSQAQLSFPTSAIIYSYKSLPSVIDKFEFPVILKRSGGRQGRGVYKIKDKKELEEKIKELEGQSLFFVIREFIPNDGDIRVFTVGYKAIGAMKRMPTKKGEFRSNISVGGRGEEFDLKKYPEIKKLAEKASEITGTEIAGVDIIINKKTGKPYILEVNPGPQFAGLEKYTRTNAAKEIVRYFEKVYNMT